MPRIALRPPEKLRELGASREQRGAAWPGGRLPYCDALRGPARPTLESRQVEGRAASEGALSGASGCPHWGSQERAARRQSVWDFSFRK